MKSSASKHLDLWYPKTSQENYVLKSGESVNVFCPPRTDEERISVVEPAIIKVRNIFLSSRVNKSFVCAGNDKFVVGKISNHYGVISNLDAYFRDFSCYMKNNSSYSSILRPTNKGCGIGHRYEISLPVSDTKFLRIIDLCHYEKRSHTFWAHHVIHPTVKLNDNICKNWTFQKSILYEDLEFSYDSVDVYTNLLYVFDFDKRKVDKYASTNKGLFSLDYKNFILRILSSPSL